MKHGLNVLIVLQVDEAHSSSATAVDSEVAVGENKNILSIVFTALCAHALQSLIAASLSLIAASKDAQSLKDAVQ